MKNIFDFTFKRKILNAIILWLVAGLSHFVYELSGENIIIGLFNPVNESVWEHLKFMFFPLLIWWVIIYFFNKKSEISIEKWIVSSGISIIAAPLSVILIFYSYKGALGIESVLIDILLAFISFFIALSIGNHFLKYLNPKKIFVYIICLVVIAMFAAFMIFTVYTPKLPIFFDTLTGEYGI